MRPDAILQFLTITAFDILRQVVYEIFALAEGDGEHKFSLRSSIEPECRKFQVGDHAGINQIDDLSSINRVASEPVWMPSQDSGSLARLYTLQHLCEYRSTWHLCSLFFNKYIYNIKLLFSGELTQLGELVGKGSHLPILGVGRFAGVNKIFFLDHEYILPNFCKVKKKNLCVSGAQRASLRLRSTCSVEKRSTSASFNGLLFAPGGCRYGGAPHGRHKATVEGARAVRTDAPGAPRTHTEAEVGRFEPVIAFAMKITKPVRIRLLRDRALVFSPRAPFALVSEIPKNANKDAGGAAGGVWGGMPPRPPHCDVLSPFSGDSEFFANLCRFLNKVRTFFAENPT